MIGACPQLPFKEGLIPDGMPGFANEGSSLHLGTGPDRHAYVSS